MATLIFPFAGQSNMVGYRAGLSLLPSHAGALTPTFFELNGTARPFGPIVWEDPTGTEGYRAEDVFVPKGMASFGYGVEILLSLIAATPDTDVITVKSAQGATSLFGNWNVTRDGRNWQYLEANLEAAMAAAGRPSEVALAPLVWWQGESDTTSETRALAYYDSLTALIAAYRETVGNPEARVVIVMTVTGGTPENRAIVAAAQQQIADEDPNVAIYDPSHLTRYPDGLHFSYDFAIEAAADLARLMVDLGWLETPNLWGSAEGDVLRGDARDQSLWGLRGDDTLIADAGDDVLAGDLGADVLNGGPGYDTAVYNGSLSGVDVSLARGTGRGGSAEGDRLTSIEALEGTAFSDRLEGNAADNRLVGLAGDDTLIGNAGDDLLIGGPGADLLDGGPGEDTVSYESATRSVRVDLADPRNAYGDAVGDVFTGIEVFRTGNTQDQLRGDEQDNVFFTGGLSDRLYGRGGNDVLDGGAGADALYGNLGADLMTGGAGADTRDRFIYFQMAESGVGAGNRDIITDFVSGVDRIEISRFDADVTQGFKQDFVFVGDVGLSGAAGELAYVHEGGNTIVQADVDGDGLADFEIELRGVIDLSADDFLL